MKVVFNRFGNYVGLRIVRYGALLVMLCIVNYTLCVAQGVGGYPLSAFESNLPVLKVISVSLPNAARAAINEDLNNDDKWNNQIGVAIRTDIDVLRDGEWIELRGGKRICRLKLNSEGALALSLKFEDFEVGGDGKVFVYNDDMSELLGAFTKGNNGVGDLLTDYINGSSLIVEFEGESDLSNVKIGEVAYFYKGVATSGNCQVNIACPEGDNYRDQINSVVQVVTKVGMGYYNCTGTLINNSRHDKTPYILTAFHCAHNMSGSVESSETDYESYRFVFNYQYGTCDGLNPKKGNLLVGAKRVASAEWKSASQIGSDFLLLRLNDTIPNHFKAYFSGWDRTGQIVSDGVTIHHPSGDYKKISTFVNPLTQTNYPSGGYPMGFFGVKWAKTVSGFGTTEGGSSGAGLFKSNGLLIGTLTGGNAGCDNTSGSDYFSMFSKSWDSNGTSSDKKLAPWLDPIGSGTYILSGISVTGIDDIEDKVVLNAYPNPAIDYVTVDLPDGLRLKKAVLFDITGREFLVGIEEIDSNRLQVDVRGVKTGVCFLRVEFDDNRSTVVKLVISE